MSAKHMDSTAVERGRNGGSSNVHGKARWRHEYKYMIDAKQEMILSLKASCALYRDSHVGKEGTYIVRSLYLDDLNNSCLAENISGSDPRSKFRIRYYNSDTSLLLLEKKIKNRGMCLKESCKLSTDECAAIMRGSFPTITEDMPKVKQRLLSEVEMRALLPKVIVTYERAPFIYGAGNVRVTFDRGITSSEDIQLFDSGNYRQRPILPCGHSIMEVKWDEVFPKHIKGILQMEGLEWIAFSKYFMCRRLHL